MSLSSSGKSLIINFSSVRSESFSCRFTADIIFSCSCASASSFASTPSFLLFLAFIRPKISVMMIDNTPLLMIAMIIVSIYINLTMTKRR